MPIDPHRRIGNSRFTATRRALNRRPLVGFRRRAGDGGATNKMSAITNIISMSGEASGCSNDGHFHPARVVAHERIPGLRAVNVQLAGFDFNFRQPEKHKSLNGQPRTLDHIFVRISDVQYDSATGAISFKLDGHYHGFDSDVDRPDHHDQHRPGETPNDDFDWKVFYTVLAFS